MSRLSERDLELEELNAGPTPEQFFECSECNGEGAIEHWESVSKWSIDPPCAHVTVCRICNGAGGFIDEAEGDK